MPGTTHKVACFKDPNIERQVVELVRGINASIPSSEKGQPNGVATLDANGKVPESQLPPIAGMEIHGNEWHDPAFETPAGAQAKVDAHASRTDNPHQVTAAQVGAVPVTGGRITGDVILQGVSALIRRPTSWGEWARGLVFQKEDGTTDVGIVAYGSSGDSVDKIAIGFGASLWAGNPGFQVTRTGASVNGNTVWHAGNDGSGSGSDMDMLDGYHASYFQPASDERLKADIQPLADALSKVLSLRGVSFVWNDKAREVSANRQTMAGREIGLLAGEVAQVVPEVVLDWVETPDGEKYKTVDSARLVALLVEAIKELNAKVEDLQERVAALEGGTP